MKTQEIKDILGRNIKHFRFLRKLSQAALAEKADISITFLSNIERGKMFPKVETLSRLTESLEVEVSWLFKTNPASSDEHEGIMYRLTENIKDTISSVVDEALKKHNLEKT